MQEVQETWVQFLGWEDLLEQEMAAHSSILTWKIPGTEEPGGLQSMGSQRVRHDRSYLAQTLCIKVIIMKTYTIPREESNKNS